MGAQEQTVLSEAVITVLMSHRYKKDDEFLRGFDFSIVRDCMYSYTVEARERFMAVPIFAFLFHHFCTNGVKGFLESNCGRKGGSYARELEYELESLHKEAFHTMVHAPLVVD